MHTILGAGGVIGRELSACLAHRGLELRQVGRMPKRVSPGDQVVPADLLDPAATARVVEGSEVAYLVAGLRYDAEVWEEEWPRIMDNVVAACVRHTVPLVFFDNVYAYGRVEGAMTEETPFNPCSRKGEVRARIATTLLDAMKRGELRALILRAADFYGPGASNSFTDATVIRRLKEGKTPRWIGNEKAFHTFTLTLDAARSAAILGTSGEGWGETWHALSPAEPISGGGFVRLACEVYRQPYDLQVPPRWLLRLMGRFNPVLRENEEMMYQFEEDYRFESSKLARRFGLEAVPYRRGLQASFYPMDERDLRADLRAGTAG